MNVKKLPEIQKWHFCMLHKKAVRSSRKKQLKLGRYFYHEKNSCEKKYLMHI